MYYIPCTINSHMYYLLSLTNGYGTGYKCEVSANEYPIGILLSCLSCEGEGKLTGIINFFLSALFERVNTKRVRIC